MQQRGDRHDAAPRGISTLVPGRSPGSWDRAYRLPVSWGSQWLGRISGHDAGAGRWLIRPRALTVAGAAEALATEYLFPKGLCP